MRDILYLAWRYLAYNRLTAGILVLSIGVIVFLPVGLQVLVSHSFKSVMTRAESTPLVIGEKGSPLELALNTLYFESETPPEIPYAESQRVADSGLATAIPIYNRFRAEEFPIVGTAIDYFDFRNLSLAEGRRMGRLGECVLGAEVAQSLGLAVGDGVVSTSESVFDFAGVYPLKMKVVGVLESAGTPDDRAIFADVKTTWVIAGLAHGHQDLTQPEASEYVLERAEGTVVANAAVVQYNEITDANRHSFHFHGDQSTFPITAVVALPDDAKSGVLLRGQYLGESERMQIILPSKVVADLLDTVLTVRAYLMAGAALAGGATLMTVALIFMLSLRLRRSEIETMRRIGVSGGRVSALLGTEIAVVLVSGVVLAGALTLLLLNFGEALVQNLLF